MTCPSCGASLAPSAKFCNHCGGAVAHTPAPVITPAGPRCPACQSAVAPGAHFCASCGAAVPLAAPDVWDEVGGTAIAPIDIESVRAQVPPAATTGPASSSGPGYAPQPVSGVASGGAEGSASFTEQVAHAWPVPDNEVAVGGRRVSIELVAMSIVYAVFALWLIILSWDLLKLVPDAVKALFSSSSSFLGGYSFLFSWGILAAVAILVWIIGLVIYTAVALLRGDPLGRALCTVLSVALLVTAIQVRLGQIWAIALLSLILTAIAWVSPNCRRAFAAWPGKLPSPVNFARVLGIWYFSQTALVVLFALPGLRFIGDLGAKWVFYVILNGLAAGLGIAGAYLLGTQRTNAPRFLLVGGALALLISLVLLTSVSTGDSDGSAWVQSLVLLVALVIALFVMPSARSWFPTVGTPAGALASGAGSGSYGSAPDDPRGGRVPPPGNQPPYNG